MTPSQAHIDAALRLAEADCAHYDDPESATAFAAHEKALSDYRATLPKLRSRAEVDAEIAETCRNYHKAEPPGIRDTELGLCRILDRLCAEPVAPESAQTFHERVAELIGMSDGDQGRYIYADEESVLRELRVLKERANYFNPSSAEPAPEVESITHGSTILTMQDRVERLELACELSPQEYRFRAQREIRADVYRRLRVIKP